MHRQEAALYKKIKASLLKEIADMKDGDNRLEPEEKLAQRFGTSRATIREALSELIQQGYITSWQGRGNFGHPHATELQMRFDITSGFYQLLQGSCEEVEITQSKIRIAPPTEDLVERLPKWAGEDCFHFDWIYGCGGEPFIVGKVQVLKSQMKYLLTHREDETCLSDYLQKFHNGDVIYTTTWVKAVHSAEMEEKFSLPRQTPILMWDEFFYDLYDRQICYNQVYFHPDRTKLSMLLRTI